MTSGNDVDTLVEMGFTHQQAIEALKATGNNVESAIAHLFGETQAPEASFSDLAAQKPTTLTVSLANPEDVPQIFGSFAAPHNSSAGSFFNEYPTAPGGLTGWDSKEPTIQQEEDVIHIEHQEDTSTSSSPASSIRSVGLEIESNLVLPSNIKGQEHVFPVILNRSPANKCWAPILCILSTYAPFSKLVLESYDDSDVVKELQRIVYFLNNFPESKRWYIEGSAKGVSLPEGPNYQYMDEEVVLNMLTQLMVAIPDLKTLFESYVESQDDEITKEMVILEIESDVRYPSLYTSLNEMFWQKDYSLLGLVKYHSVAPIVTYQLLCDEESYTTPFELSEVFYPEIYSGKCEAAIKDQIELIKQAQLAHQALSRKLMGLNFFEGKRIDTLLQTTKDALKGSCYGTTDDILALMSQLETARANEIQFQKKCKEEASPDRLNLYDKVLELVPDVKAYLLIGVIISECKYFLRYQGSWVQMEDNERIDFDELRDIVKHVSRIGPHVITLIYAESTTLGEAQLDKQSLSKDNSQKVEEEPEELIDLNSDVMELSACKTEDLSDMIDADLHQTTDLDAEALNVDHPEETCDDSGEMKPNTKLLSERQFSFQKLEQQLKNRKITISVKPDLVQEFEAEEAEVLQLT